VKIGIISYLKFWTNPPTLEIWEFSHFNHIFFNLFNVHVWR